MLCAKKKFFFKLCLPKTRHPLTVRIHICIYVCKSIEKSNVNIVVVVKRPMFVIDYAIVCIFIFLCC